MTSSPETAARPRALLEHVPVPLFAVVMGVCGLGLVWRKAHHVLSVPKASATPCWSPRQAYSPRSPAVPGQGDPPPRTVAAEFSHPIRANFFPAVSISILLLSRAALSLGQTPALVLWGLGTAIHLGFTILLVRRWIVRNQDISTPIPPGSFPLVGNIRCR
jgi:tellurite resistance protein